MKKTQMSLAALAVAALLTACGGSDEGIVVEEKDPTPSGLAATATLSNATGADVVLNGIYATSDVLLNNVTKVNPPGDDPETCRFEFQGLVQAGSNRQLMGDVRYLPGTESLQQTFLGVEGTEFGLVGTTGGAVDRTNGRVTFTGAVFTSIQGTGRTITVNGVIPMRPDRPEGC
jgi:hypothetical protein